MWERLKEWVRRWLNVQPASEPSPDKYVREYESISRENVAATIANKLATFVFADSTMTVTDVHSETPGARVALIDGILSRLWDEDAGWITAQMLGKGGKVIVPVVSGGSIELSIFDQNRLLIRDTVGNRITAATLLIDAEEIDSHQYFLMADYTLVAGGLYIRYRAVDEGGSPVSFSDVPRWENTAEELMIPGSERILFAFLRCPRDNRRDEKRLGVPITYGAGAVLDELAEHIAIYRREYKLTRAMLGLDSTLWKNPYSKPVTIDAIRETVQDSDDPFIPVEGSALNDKSTWQYYAPAIRQEAMEARYQALCRRVEKACGLSQGILTERQTMNYANRDEVRAAQYDTFTVVKAVRDQWERALDDLAYAIDILAEAYGITPAGGRGQYELQFDWDTSLIESTAEAWSQNLELHAAGALSDAELRQWVRGGTIEENEEAVEEIRAKKRENSPIQQLLQQPEEPEEE